MATFETFSRMEAGYPVRLASMLPVAAGITVLLFLLMRAMISMQFQLDETPKTFIPSINPVIKELDKPSVREMPLPDDVVPPPPPPRIARQVAQNPADTDASATMAIPVMDLPELGQGKAIVFITDRNVQPIIHFAPVYPVRARQQGREGSCRGTFDVSSLGKPYNIQVTCTDPVFVRAAKRAIERWKYNPKIEHGIAVPRRGLETPMRFMLDKDGH